MPKVVVEVADSFSAFGKDFAIGEIIADSVFSGWPDGTVEKRLANGFLKHKVVPDVPKPEVDLSDLEALNSEELIAIGSQFGLVLDPELSDEEKVTRIRIIAGA